MESSRTRQQSWGTGTKRRSFQDSSPGETSDSHDSTDEDRSVPPTSSEDELENPSSRLTSDVSTEEDMEGNSSPHSANDTSSEDELQEYPSPHRVKQEACSEVESDSTPCEGPADSPPWEGPQDSPPWEGPQDSPPWEGPQDSPRFSEDPPDSPRFSEDDQERNAPVPKKHVRTPHPPCDDCGVSEEMFKQDPLESDSSEDEAPARYNRWTNFGNTYLCPWHINGTNYYQPEPCSAAFPTLLQLKEHLVHRHNSKTHKLKHVPQRMGSHGDVVQFQRIGDLENKLMCPRHSFSGQPCRSKVTKTARWSLRRHNETILHREDLMLLNCQCHVCRRAFRNRVDFVRHLTSKSRYGRHCARGLHPAALEDTDIEGGWLIRKEGGRVVRVNPDGYEADGASEEEDERRATKKKKKKKSKSSKTVRHEEKRRRKKKKARREERSGDTSSLDSESRTSD